MELVIQCIIIIINSNNNIIIVVVVAIVVVTTTLFYITPFVLVSFVRFCLGIYLFIYLFLFILGFSVFGWFRFCSAQEIHLLHLAGSWPRFSFVRNVTI